TTKLATMRADIAGRPRLRRWFESAAAPLERARILGFLHRYEVLARAREAGIRIPDETWDMPAVAYSRTRESPTLPLVYFAGDSGVSREVERFSDPDELGKIFGSYATLDVVAGGALARIIVRE